MVPSDIWLSVFSSSVAVCWEWKCNRKLSFKVESHKALGCMGHGPSRLAPFLSVDFLCRKYCSCLLYIIKKDTFEWNKMQEKMDIRSSHLLIFSYFINEPFMHASKVLWG